MRKVNRILSGDLGGRMAITQLKYLIVMPRFVQNSGDGYQFPLGICYVSSSMKKHGFQVYTLNLNHYEDISVLDDYISKYDIDVVITGGLSVHYRIIRPIVERVKKINQNITTIVGGGIISGDPQASMEALNFIDFGIIGEGEVTTCELASALENGQEFHEVDGLIIRNKDGSYSVTNERKEIEDINKLPWPDYEGFEFEKTLSTPPGISGMNSKRMVFMISSRSCPYSCTFCFHTVGNKYRQRTLDDFFTELDFMINKYQVEYLCLEDELFSTDLNRVREFCSRIKKYNIKYWVQVRVSNVNEEILNLLKNSGCDTISFGLESADNRILKSMRKGTTINQIEDALKLVLKSDIHIQGNFIFGDIAETWETAMNTLDWWKNHTQYRIDFSMISIYPGTYLYKYACEKGLITDRVKYLQEGCPQVNVSQLSDDEFAKLLNMILELPKKHIRKLKDIKYSNFNYMTGRIDAEGECEICNTISYWSNVKLFMINFVGCSKCGHKYNLELTDELTYQIEKNMEKLLNEFNCIGMWGMNTNAYDLINMSNVIKNDRIKLIDISEVAQNIAISGKKVNSPDVIYSDNIEAIVVCVPHHYSPISERIISQYKDVKRIINILELINPSFDCGY